MNEAERQAIRERFEWGQENLGRGIDNLDDDDIRTLTDEIERSQKERDEWKDKHRAAMDVLAEMEGERDEWKQRYADLLQEKNRYYKLYRENVNKLQEVKEKASLTVEGWSADHQAAGNEIEEWKAKAERLEMSEQLLIKIKNAWIGIEFMDDKSKAREMANDFYTIVQDILAGDSE